MYFDFEDHRPETPRVPHAISVREGVLLSIIFHLGLVIFILLFPDFLRLGQDEASDVAMVQPDTEQPPLRFVEAMPLADIPRPPERPADQSDQDRRASAPEPPPEPANLQPFMRGNTPEMIEGGPRAPAPPPPASPATPADSSTAIRDDSGRPTLEQPIQAQASTQGAPSTDLTQAFRDVGRYLRDQRFDNPQGGQTDKQADIQFDSMGVDFGWWLRRFKNQVERNWIIPASVMMYQGRVVVRFTVLRNGTLIGLDVLQPASISALTTAAVNSLKLSNPTAELPREYPADRMVITVTFHYNEDPRSYR